MEVKYVLTFKRNFDLNITNAQKLSKDKAKEITDKLILKFSKLLKERRRTLGYSMFKLYRLSGVSSSTINDIEKGRYFPHLEVIFKLSYPLKIKYGDILKCFDIDSKNEKTDYIKSLKDGDIIGIYSSCEKAEDTMKKLANNYIDVKEEDFDIREIVWD